MSILQYKPMGILIISKMVPDLKIYYLNQLQLTCNTSIVLYDYLGALLGGMARRLQLLQL